METMANSKVFPDDLSTLRDDMIAFIEGHGMQRFPGNVDFDTVPSVVWKPGDNPDSWKDFVELAKSAGSIFVTMDSWTLQREEVEDLIKQLEESDYGSDDELEEARWMRDYIGKTGCVQAGFAHQGIMMVFEADTEWFSRYRAFIDFYEDSSDITTDESGLDV